MISIDHLTIDVFKADGFLHVCDICTETSTSDILNYININEQLMYDLHGGWVYLIVVDGMVKKVGETGHPLGIRPKYNGNQPVGGTKARLARYRRHKDSTRNDTDQCIRRELQIFINNKSIISFWAKKCKNPDAETMVLGELRTIKTEFHKVIEKLYLNSISEEYGELPPLNKLTG